LVSKNGPTDGITPEIFEHLVQLAAFELSPEEAEYLRKELNAQMSAIRELEAIQVETETLITSHGVPYSPDISPGLREDVSEACPEAEDILAGAPESQDRYIIVPDIPHEELK
jgi:aspartyl/glutamyl-tRNA(Asn/Gln) amidotransferase C subunit